MPICTQNYVFGWKNPQTMTSTRGLPTPRKSVTFSGKKFYEDIELGVLRSPKCCAANKCDGAEE
jgi:hypothetical protein